MTRESRILVTLLVMSGIGLTGLMLMANQYKKSLARSGAQSSAGRTTSERAIRLVEGYLAGRRAAKAVVEHHPEPLDQLSANTVAAFRTERGNAFTARGLSYEDYAFVRAAWRTFRAGGIVDDQVLVAVFQARREELEAASLGPAEGLDDAVK